jgi:hypothetical protein
MRLNSTQCRVFTSVSTARKARGQFLDPVFGERRNQKWLFVIGCLIWTVQGTVCVVAKAVGGFAVNDANSTDGVFILYNIDRLSSIS